MASTFDATAASFERYRPLPEGIPETIRAAIWSEARLLSPAKVLDIGAGTGRIGKAFVAAGDFYVGMDASLAMLREFAAKPGTCLLVQADGSQLPFRSGAFDVVLLMQVLSVASNWRNMLNEAQRALGKSGRIAVGHSVGPQTGISAQLKRQLRAILEEMHVGWERPQETRRQALAWLESSTQRHVHIEAATWNANISAKEFLQRQRTGARFAGLPPVVQEQAIGKLHEWSETVFGSADTCFEEKQSFEVDIFEL